MTEAIKKALLVATVEDQASLEELARTLNRAGYGWSLGEVAAPNQDVPFEPGKWYLIPARLSPKEEFRAEIFLRENGVESFVFPKAFSDLRGNPFLEDTYSGKRYRIEEDLYFFMKIPNSKRIYSHLKSALKNQFGFKG